MSACRLKGRRGFTLLELVVVILIIGILAAFAMPQYMKSLEVNKAEDAAALVNMVATTNRMYALDHGGTPVSGTITNTCNSSSTCPDTTNPQCSLISCKYLAATDWNAKPYVIGAGNGTAADCALAGSSVGTQTGVACAGRRTSNAQAAYQGWGYRVDTSGSISCIPGPCGGANPPTPSQ